MSKIALTPNASGSGTFTIASPNSDTDRTLTLPDEAGTVLTSGTSASSIPGYGNQINEYDIWILKTSPNANVNDGETTVPSQYWGRPTTFASYEKIGTGMTNSGTVDGIFTFPSTGKWKVEFKAGFDTPTNQDARSVYTVISVTANNGSSWHSASITYNQFQQYQSATSFWFNWNDTLIDVTDTSQVKVRFRFGTSASSNINMQSSTDNGMTTATFIRIGDT